jgi:serine/threonine protein kinase
MPISSVQPAWETALKLGRYSLLHPLGAGATGVVYAAYDPELDRKVALKIIRPSSGAEGSAGGSEASESALAAQRGRLFREAQAMARLSHPNVIAVHDVGAVQGEVFIAMEFVEGTTLAGWLEQQPRGWREILETFILAGRGLAAAHAAGVVHRDFKPENVLVGKDGRVRVTDFGLARSETRLVPISGERAPVAPSSRAAAAPLDTAGAPGASVAGVSHSSEKTIIQSSRLGGSPAYMSPEQKRG